MASTGSDHFGAFAQYGESIAAWTDSVSWLALVAGPVAIGIGLTLWLVGGRMMRPGAVLAGGVAGAWFGATQLPALWSAVDPVIGGVIFLIVGLALGFALFRLSVAVLLAAVLGLAAPVGVGLAMDMHRTVNGSAAHGSLSEEFMLLRGVPVERDDATHEETAEDDDDTLRGIEAVTRDARERAYAFAAAMTEEVGERWKSIDQNNRRALFASSVIGALLGFFAGIVAPRFAAGGVTAGAGAALWLGAGVWTLRSFRPEDADRLPSSALAWLAIWFVVAFAGAAFQWAPIAKGRKRARATPAPPKAEA
ncbi:MAG: hypothetical protein EA379_02115 [Phycisphaerales bacterium]|nr:MAG: hypothetical protein EA379_02115 [Phycisphaerales bacterium]